MELKAMLFLLLACGSLPEGRTREPRPFHCTKPVKESTTRHETSSPRISSKQPTTQLQLTTKTTTYQANTEKSTTDRPVTVKLTNIPTTDPLNHEESTLEPSTESQLTEVTTKQLILTSPTKLELTSDQQATKQQTPTQPTSSTKQEFNKQLTSISSTSPTKQELTSDQQTTKHLTSTPPTSPPCAPNMVLGPSCDCKRTCQNPTMCNCEETDQTCVCPDGFLMSNTECLPEQECECYYDEGGLVVPDGDIYINDDCTERCTCSNNQLSCDSYTCSTNAECGKEEEVRQCYCKDGYVGDGDTCKRFTDCYDAYQAGRRQDGFFTILPYGWLRPPFKVSCDMTTSGGGWTIIQRHGVGGIHIPWRWSDYKYGFESIFTSFHWLGNDKLFYLTNQRNYTLRVDLVSSDNSSTYQEYSMFKIANESDNYRLIDLGSSSGTAGHGMDGSMGRKFSTQDRDNDECDDIDCSNTHGWAGWWYSNKWCNECCNRYESTCFYQSNNCNKRCTKANLNGWYDNDNPSLYYTLFWNNIQNIISTEMKIRPATRAVQ